MISDVDETLVQRRIGQRIRSCRSSAGLTQQDVASALGLTRSSVSNIEAGTQSLSLIAFLKIAQELGMAPGVMLDGVTAHADLPDARATDLPVVYQSWLEALKRDDAPGETFVRARS